MSVFPRKNSKTESSLNFLQSGPRKFTKSDFSGLAPIRRVLITEIIPGGRFISNYRYRVVLPEEECFPLQKQICGNVHREEYLTTDTDSLLNSNKFHYRYRLRLRVPAPPTKYKTPLKSKIHPKIHPESSPETKLQRKYTKK